ncbi:hypothetical protein ACIGCM_20765 [Pseudomonas sp. NPDC078700]|uniref:hypothetical protein n=1 Tax=Pseudomonas sp. NPDC078700 TaxID=3364424 RepID=UPI0037CA01BC
MNYYSASTNRCYSSELKELYKSSDNWPEDARKISEKLFAKVVNNRSSNEIMVAGKDGLPTLIVANPVTITSICIQLDNAADAARLAVTGNPTRATEYERAAAEAQAFKDAGYPHESVPRTVAAWAINGRTAQQATDSILAESATYTEALYRIRETRLCAKEQVRAAMAAGNQGLAQQIAVQAIAIFNAGLEGASTNLI